MSTCEKFPQKHKREWRTDTVVMRSWVVLGSLTLPVGQCPESPQGPKGMWAQPAASPLAQGAPALAGASGKRPSNNMTEVYVLAWHQIR